MIAATLAFAAGPNLSFAQVAPVQPIPFPPRPPELPEKLPPSPPPVPLLPPVPPTPPKREPSPPIRAFIHDIHVLGNTIFTYAELEEIIKPYRGRELTVEDMEALRLALTMYYVDRGYVTSGAIIPDQAVTFNVLTIQIIEGMLSRIDVEGNDWLWSGYVRHRVLRGATTPLNTTPLQERLQFLQQDLHIERLNAELKPGVTLGESVLNVQVKEAPIFHGRVEFNNFLSPSVGAEQGLGTLEDTNVTGLGDSLSVQYGQSKGVNPIINARYVLPLNAYDTTISAQYRKSAFAVQSAQFKALDIRNDAHVIGLSIRQPLYRTLQKEFAVGIGGDYEKNSSTLLGEPFEFVAGATNGEFRVAALRVFQEWLDRTNEQVISAFSRFSLGTGLFNATGASSTPQSATGRFFSWLGEAQWVRQLQPLRTQMLARTVLQLSNQHLFPLEQIAVGGRYSVRGYREYSLVHDNAYMASLEFRVPVFTTAAGMDLVHLAPFIDVGHAWNTDVPTPDPQTLASVGLGLLVNVTTTRYFNSHFELYWGNQLNHLRLGQGNLQDHGIHLQLVVQVF